MQCRIISSYYLDTINAFLPFLRSDRGSGKKTGCRENLIALLYYGRQLKGEDMKYGMLLGVDAVLFYQFKDEASDIVWKRTK